MSKLFGKIFWLQFWFNVYCFMRRRKKRAKNKVSRRNKSKTR